MDLINWNIIMIPTSYVIISLRRIIVIIVIKLHITQTQNLAEKAVETYQFPDPIMQTLFLGLSAIVKY